MMEILIIGAYLFIGICLALYVWEDLNHEGEYSFYVVIICMWPAIVLIGIILWIVDWINRHTGGSSLFF